MVTTRGPEKELHRQTSTHHLVVPQPFCGLDGPVQTGFPHIHVLSVGVPRQELHQSPNVYVVIVVHMTEPPERQKSRII